MKTISFLLLACLNTFVMADFTNGIIKMSVSDPEGSGSIGLYLSPGATVSEVSMTPKQVQMHINMKFLIKHAESSKVYQINDAGKSYSIIDISSYQQKADAQVSPKFTITKKGKVKLLGFKAQHIIAEHQGEITELWLTKDIGIYSYLEKLQSANPKASNQLALYKALEKQGLGGFPLKVVTMRNGAPSTIEVTSVKEKKLPASVFNIPAGYKQTANPLAGLGALMSGPDGAQNMEMMKKIMQQSMTPENMKKLQEMMQQMPQQAPNAPSK